MKGGAREQERPRRPRPGAPGAAASARAPATPVPAPSRAATRRRRRRRQSRRWWARHRRAKEGEEEKRVMREEVERERERERRDPPSLSLSPFNSGIADESLRSSASSPARSPASSRPPRPQATLYRNRRSRGAMEAAVVSAERRAPLAVEARGPVVLPPTSAPSSSVSSVETWLTGSLCMTGLTPAASQARTLGTMAAKSGRRAAASAGRRAASQDSTTGSHPSSVPAT